MFFSFYGKWEQNSHQNATFNHRWYTRVPLLTAQHRTQRLTWTWVKPWMAVMAWTVTMSRGANCFRADGVVGVWCGHHTAMETQLSTKHRANSSWFHNGVWPWPCRTGRVCCNTWTETDGFYIALFCDHWRPCIDTGSFQQDPNLREFCKFPTNGLAATFTRYEQRRGKEVYLHNRMRNIFTEVFGLRQNPVETIALDQSLKLINVEPSQ